MSGLAIGIGLFLLAGVLIVALVKGADFFLAACEDVYKEDKNV